MDHYDRIHQDITFFKATLAEVIKMIHRMEADSQDAYLWGHGTLDVRTELQKLIDGKSSLYWG